MVLELSKKPDMGEQNPPAPLRMTMGYKLIDIMKQDSKVIAIRKNQKCIK